MHKLHTLCIPVSGYCRSAIYNLLNGSYCLVPNTLYDLLSDCPDIDSWYSIVGTDDHFIVDEYTAYLKKNGCLLNCDSFDFNKFENLSLDYSNSSIVSSINITLSEECKKYSSELIHFLKETYVENISIIIEKSNLKQLERFLLELNDTYICNIEIFLNNCEFENDLKSLFLINHSVSKFVFFNSDYDSSSFLDDSRKIQIIHSVSPSISFLSIEKIFIVNMLFFIESVSRNAYYNKKLFIDEKCNLLNSYKSSPILHIKDFQVNNFLKVKSIDKYWRINKDLIDICMDCEFRYMCYDPRLPEEKSKNKWTYNSNCHYNPYISKWSNEEGFIAVEEWRIQNPNWEKSAKREPLVKKLQNMEKLININS